MPIQDHTIDPYLEGFTIQVWPAHSKHAQAHMYRDQILAGSLEPEMVLWEPEDACKRFASTESYDAWAKNGRVIVGLTKGDTLSGMCYFGKKDLDIDGLFHGSATVAIRMYQHARGQGLALPFFKRAHRIIEDYMCIDGLWLSVRSDNDRARHIYKQAGYRVLSDYGQYTYMAYDRDSI